MKEAMNVRAARLDVEKHWNVRFSIQYFDSVKMASIRVYRLSKQTDATPVINHYTLRGEYVINIETLNANPVQVFKNICIASGHFAISYAEYPFIERLVEDGKF